MSNIVDVVIQVDLDAGCTLDHTCAKCGKTAKSKATSYDCQDRTTGGTLPYGVFVIRCASSPEGWEHIRVDGKHVEVCSGCLKKFLEPT